MELPLSMVSKLAFWYLYLPDYLHYIITSGLRYKVQLLNCTHAAMNAYIVGTVYTACNFYHT